MGAKVAGWRNASANLGRALTTQGQRLKRKVTDFRRSNVVFEVSQPAEVPFHAQGRRSLYTNEMIESRLALRREPELIAVLEVWWSTAQRSQSSSSKLSGRSTSCTKQHRSCPQTAPRGSVRAQRSKRLLNGSSSRAVSRLLIGPSPNPFLTDSALLY